MTKRELAIAQFLYDIAEGGYRWADEIDPERLGPKRLRGARAEMVLWLDRLSRTASEAFFYLTGKHPVEVESMVELSTARPAGWTREVTHRL